ncbi:ATP-grasp domain-containing protein [Palleronia marisminoris]|uniref:Carbamoyl phosphate synthase-like protein n=1 Tax=Palleronia marisminoris TaxID=315423 RepID=A0A1Y5S663_9RHOB|nr:ATP-grasp domain-containing protein [Palleronia marisminoris]SFG64597.1 ATP-grasp domain-containing protein [Palleronia marisminoris]SLN33446.1 carbamoyl phosphate synthase-like protein [Palleronia marisminoris]
MPEAAKKTICIIGNDPFNDDYIKRIPEAQGWNVVTVLHHDDVQPADESIDFDALYDRAHAQIAAMDSPPDAIIGHLDFPVTSLVALLNRDFGLKGASPEAVARCEHKFWMREAQREVFPDDTPAVTAVNPFKPAEAQEAVPEYPFWLKPVKGHSSKLGFLVRDADDLDSALHECRRFIHQHGEPFNRFLARLEPDSGCPEGVNGNFAVAEELVSANRLFTIEGLVENGETRVVGAVESLKGGGAGVSFSRYQYPSDIPDEIVEKGRVFVAKLLDHFGFDNGPFNVEFFYDDDTGALRLLEINPRLSKSHSPLFHIVDGATHHRQAILLALGEEVEMPARGGHSPVAAKFMIRSNEEDGIVRGVPDPEQLEELKDLFPDLAAQILVQPGQRLSDLPDQDSYTYELADLFIGGADLSAIEDAYLRCRHSLEFLIKPIPENL